jgi:hypothetical protein
MTRPAPHTITTSEVKKTALAIRELHATNDGEKLNEEWFLLENVSQSSINLRGCVLTVAENAHRRPQVLGTLDPGFILSPGAQIRVVTGNPARKSEGAPPAETEELKNYHLFLKHAYVGVGVVVRLTLRQLDLARATFAPDQPNGVGPV